MLTEPLQLATDVRRTPVASLSRKVRSRLEADPGDIVWSRPATRLGGLLIDAEGDALVQEFTRPKTVALAVLERSRESGGDAQRLLEEAIPLLLRLREAGLLVTEGSDFSAALQPTLERGERVDGFEIVRPHQILFDTEVYEAAQVGCGSADGRAAFKLARPGCVDWVVQAIRREAVILDHLDGEVAPAFLAAGTWRDRPYLAMEWIEGDGLQAVAKRLRAPGCGDGRVRLLELARALARAYRDLHGLGVLHGDVHPGNLLVTAEGAVRIVDFGLARRPHTDLGEAVARGGVAFFLEPEHARALSAEQPREPSSFAGEQYAVAAVLHGLFTGAPYLDFAAEKTAIWRQIIDQEPVAFTDRGVPSWPALEGVLCRALAKNPQDRFPDLGAFTQALDAVTEPRGPDPSTAASPRIERQSLEQLTESVIGRLGFSGPTFEVGKLAPPSASVNCGAAGMALGLLRLSMARDSSELLSAADLWITWALRQADTERGFSQPALGLCPAPRSSWNGRAGVDAVEVLVSSALDDPVRRHRAMGRFIDRLAQPQDPSKAPCLDVTDGVAGNLITVALLLTEVEEPPGGPLHHLGEKLLAELWRPLGTAGSLGDLGCPPLTGVAHGWAGFLYATLLWWRVSGAPWPGLEDSGAGGPEDLYRRLEQMARLAEPAGRGARFKATLEAGDRHVPRLYWSGWCNGSAGQVFLWALAFELTGEQRFVELAERCAWHSFEGPERTATLCCGDIGRSYALVRLHRLASDSAWLSRAWELAHRAVRGLRPQPEYGLSLYQGDLGLAVLAADLERPESSALPFFEPMP